MLENIRIETTGHKYYIEDGIVYVYVKSGLPSLEAIQESLDCLAEIKRENKSLFVLVDPRDATMLNNDQRKLASAGFNNLIDGMAILNNNLFVKLLLQFAVKFDSPSYPQKVFKDEALAKQWLTSLKEKILKK